MTDEKKGAVAVACATAKMTRFVKRAENLWKLRRQFARLDESPRNHLFHGFMMWTPSSPSSPKTRVWEDRKVESILLIDRDEKGGYTILPQQDEVNTECDARLLSLALQDFHKRHPRVQEIYVETLGSTKAMRKLFRNEGFVDYGKGLLVLNYGCEIDDAVLINLIETQNANGGALQDYIFDSAFPQHMATLAIEETSCDIEIGNEEFDRLVERVSDLSKPYQEKLREESKKCVKTITKAHVLAALDTTTRRRTKGFLAFDILNEHKNVACQRACKRAAEARTILEDLIDSMYPSMGRLQDAIPSRDIRLALRSEMDASGGSWETSDVLDRLAVWNKCVRLMSPDQATKMGERIISAYDDMLVD